MWTTRLGEVGTHCPRYGAELRRLAGLAPSELSVLLTGASGTGKELLARAIHAASGRRGPFVAINCASLPDTLIESELFGHTKGAFSGAHSERRGALCASDGGTLFLDEIGDAPLQVQASLLRALESQAVKAIGSERERPVDLRIVAATSRGLFNMMTDGSFRPDLYYRLAGHELHLPSLDERKADLPELAQELLKSLGHQGRLSLAARTYLKQLTFPGNARELRNLLARASAPLDPHATVDTPHLRPSAPPPPDSGLRAKRRLPEETHERLGAQAQAFAVSEILLVPPEMPRRKARTLERALLLVLLDRDVELSARLRARVKRVFGRGWESADRGAGGRNLARVLGVEFEVVLGLVEVWDGL